MLRWLLEPLAPVAFTKGIQVYGKGEYGKAKRLLKKAAKWMPELRDDGLYCAYDALIEFYLEGEINIENVKSSLEKIKESDYKGTASAKNAERELNSIISKMSNSTPPH